MSSVRKLSCVLFLSGDTGTCWRLCQKSSEVGQRGLLSKSATLLVVVESVILFAYPLRYCVSAQMCFCLWVQRNGRNCYRHRFSCNPEIASSISLMHLAPLLRAEATVHPDVVVAMSTTRRWMRQYRQALWWLNYPGACIGDYKWLDWSGAAKKNR